MTLHLSRIDDSITVAPQIAPEDVAAIKAAGLAVVVNNRPDDEDPGQPSGEAVAAACAAAGLAYHTIPVTHAGFTHAQVVAMIAVLGEADGAVLAYCRSGTRSCHLWALARAGLGDDPDTLIERAADAGYDLSGTRALLDSLAPRA